MPFAAGAQRFADRFGAAAHAAVERSFFNSFIDLERTLRLEAAGFETIVSSFVAPTVTPHHLAWRARYSGEPVRMAAAQSKRNVLLRDFDPTRSSP
jgi:hypothetical protein